MTSPLVTTRWLDDHLGDPAVVLADCRWYLGDEDRGRLAFAAGHIPGAVYFDLERDLSVANGPGRHPLPEAADFAERLGAKGVSNESTVVAYDDRGGAVAARLWWMMRWVGHDAVAVLDGGLTAWEAEQRPLSDEASDRSPARFSAQPALVDMVDRAAVAAAVGADPIIDARDSERYRGDVEPIDPVGGHIPSAMNLPYQGNLASDDRFLDAEVLRARFASAAAGDAIVYCGSGVTACHDLLAMHVAGLPPGRLYPGSWSDWSTSGGTVATGGARG